MNLYFRFPSRTYIFDNLFCTLMTNGWCLDMCEQKILIKDRENTNCSAQEPITKIYNNTSNQNVHQGSQLKYRNDSYRYWNLYLHYCIRSMYAWTE